MTKYSTTGSPEASAIASDPEQRRTVEEDTLEFVMLIRATTRNLKSAGPPPARLLEARQRFELGPRHMSPLLTVALAGPLSVTELSEALGLRLSSTSTLVGQLSRAGLLTRVEDEDDRRRTIVHLAEEYRLELEPWLDRVLAPVRATLERLSPPARSHFMEGWRILSEEAERGATGGDGDADCQAP
jgi:DNA-binding MarR family transcriptional regulator